MFSRAMTISFVGFPMDVENLLISLLTFRTPVVRRGWFQRLSPPVVTVSFFAVVLRREEDRGRVDGTGCQYRGHLGIKMTRDNCRFSLAKQKMIPKGVH